MASIQARKMKCCRWCKQAGKVDIAGINGPQQTVISGDETAVDAIVAYFDAANRTLGSRYLATRVHMDAMLEDFRAIAETCDYSTEYRWSAM